MKSIIENPKQLKPIILDIFNHLKAKKIIKSFEFLNSLNEYPRLMFVMPLNKSNGKSLKITIEFFKLRFSVSNGFYCKEFYTSMKFYLYRITKEILKDAILEQINHRLLGNKNEEAFLILLDNLLSSGFIQNYRKATDLENINASIDWYIKRKGKELGINVKSRELSLSQMKKDNVLYLSYNQENQKNFNETIKNIKFKISQRI